MEVNKQAYDKYVKQVTPTNNVWYDMVRAFLVGGVICTIGQVLTNLMP